MTSLHSRFEAYLNQKKGRYTQQKKDIVDAILNRNDHFEIDAFISDLHMAGCRIGRATVYRTVKQLLDANLIQKINGPNGRIYYEYNEAMAHHDHVICSQCGSISEIKNNIIERAIKNECKNLKFKQEYRSLHIYGTCHRCAGV